MLQMSGLLLQLQQHSHDEALQPLCIYYGDLACPLRLHLQAPYRHAHLTEEQQGSKLTFEVNCPIGQLLFKF